MNNPTVQEVFGQFAVNINDEVVMFPTEHEALAAHAMHSNAQAWLDSATAFTDSKGVTGKTAKGKINVILEYLAFAESHNATHTETALKAVSA